MSLTPDHLTQGDLTQGHLTQDQERAVTSFGRDLCVRAGAGSGKTRVLISRVVHLITEREMPLSSILAITFTEKAAREMKERLVVSLEEAARRGAIGPEARGEVEWAYVSTIHAFCARLLRENALEAGVDPAFDVLDEVQAGTLFRRALAEVSARWADQTADGCAALDGLAVDDFLGELEGLYGRLRGEGTSPLDLEEPDEDPGALRERVLEVVAEAREIGPLLDDAPAKSAEKAQAVLDRIPLVEDLLAGDVDPGPLRDALVALKGAINLQLSKPLKEVLRPLRDETIPRAIRAATDILARPAFLALRALLGDVHAAYSAAKEERGVLDFDDLEERALVLLRDHDAVRDAARRRFRQILVDEYQDVNPVQAAILRELCERELGEEGRHFAVGDVKQSIYGFRHAEPALFAEYGEAVGEEGRITLRENFRSSPGLVEFSNRCFSRLFAGQDLVDWSDMVAAGGYLPADGPEVEVILTDGESAGEAREAEASAIARRIREIVDGEELPLRRKSERRGEPVRFGDIALLFRALTDVKTYERAFEDLDVPYYVVKGRGFYQAREIADLIRLLRTVRNPRDEISLAATLRSPFAGLTEDGLLALVAAARERKGLLADLLTDPGEVSDLAGADRDAWPRFAGMLARLRTLSARATIRETLEAALEESGYGTAVWLVEGGRRRAANIRKALHLADSFEGLFDLSAFLDALEDFRTREVKETEAPTGGEAEDVVRILTVHGAKGLEFPVVFLPDLTRQPTFRAPVLGIRNRGFGAKIYDGAHRERYETSALSEIVEDLKRREEEENHRLLYVAVTRAEEHLVLSARKSARGSRNWWAALNSVLSEEELPPVRGPGDAAERTRQRVSLAGRHLPAIAAGEPLPEVGEADVEAARRLAEFATAPRPEPDGSEYENTVTQLLLFSHCPRCYALRYGLGIPLDFDSPRVAEEGEERERGGADELPPDVRGIAVHEVLRKWNPHAGPSALDTAVQVLPRGSPEPLIRDVARTAESFYRSPVGERALAAPPDRVRREVPYLVKWRTESGGLILRGQIDLLLDEPDGPLWVVDYKTGRTPAESYRVQLVTYARTLREFARGEPRPVFVYLSADGEPREEPVELTPETLRETEESAARFARYLRESPGIPEQHSEGCRLQAGRRAGRAP